MKGLNIKDRLKFALRAFKLALMKDNQQITILWQKTSGTTLTHTFYVDGIDPTKTPLLYFSYVAAKSDNLEQLNRRTSFFLNKIAVGYCLQKSIPVSSIQYIGEPFVDSINNK